MCQDIQQIIFGNCGHKVSYWEGESRFCLFTETGLSYYHFHTTFNQSKEMYWDCPQCHLTKSTKWQAFRSNHEKYINYGTPTGKAELAELGKAAYARTRDFREEKRAQYYLRQAHIATRRVTRTTDEEYLERIEDLGIQVRERIVFYLAGGGGKCGFNGKLALLKRIIMLDEELFDRAALVRFFASRYFEYCEEGTVERDWERPMLYSLVKQVGLEKALREGLKLAEPENIPVRRPIVVKEYAGEDEKDEEIDLEELMKLVKWDKIGEMDLRWGL